MFGRHINKPTSVLSMRRVSRSGMKVIAGGSEGGGDRKKTLKEKLSSELETLSKKKKVPREGRGTKGFPT